MGHGPSLWGGCCRPGWVGGQLSQRECLSCSSRRHEVWVHLWSPVQAETVIKPTRISAGKSRLCHKDCCCLVTQLCLILCAPWNIAHQVRFLCLWDFPGKNTGVGCHFLLQGIFPTQGSNPCLLDCQADSLPLSHLRSSHIIYRVFLFVFFLACSTTFMLQLWIFQLWVGRIKKDEGSGLAMQSGDLFGLFKCPLWWRIQTLSFFQWEHIQVLQRHCQWPSVCKGITVMGNALTGWLYKPSSAFSNISSHSLLSGFCLER